MARRRPQGSVMRDMLDAAVGTLLDHLAEKTDEILFGNQGAQVAHIASMKAKRQRRVRQSTTIRKTQATQVLSLGNGLEYIPPPSKR